MVLSPYFQAEVGDLNHDHDQKTSETYFESAWSPHGVNAQFCQLQAREYRPAEPKGISSSGCSNEGSMVETELSKSAKLHSTIVENEPTKSAELLNAIVENWHRLSQAEKERCSHFAIGSVTAKSSCSSGQKKKYFVHKDVSDRSKGGKRSKCKPAAQSIINAKKKNADVQESCSGDAKPAQIGKQPDVPTLTFRADNRDMIEAFLYTRFMQIQQSSAKVIAKAWIKAICPKKQAHYPYVDCNPRPDQPRRRPMHAGAPRVPSFWPDLKLCRHKEPDHLDKNERTHLLVHLIRLKWREPDWVRSNGKTCDVPESVRSGSWVRFLHDVFPPDRLVDAPGTTTAKSEQRVQYLRDIYRVAIAEQEFRHGASNGCSVFTFSGNIKLIHPRDAPPRSSRKGAVSPKQHPQEAHLEPRRAVTSSASPATLLKNSMETPPASITSTNETFRCSDPMMDTETTPEDVRIQTSPWSTTESAADLISPAASTCPAFNTELAMHGLCSDEEVGWYSGQPTVYSNNASGPEFGNPSWTETFSPYVPLGLANMADGTMALPIGASVVYPQQMMSFNTASEMQSFAAPTAGIPSCGEDMSMYSAALNAMSSTMYAELPGQMFLDQETPDEQQVMSYGYAYM